MIDLARSSSPTVRRLLEAHPRVNSVEGSSEPGIQFRQGSWNREVLGAELSVETSGLIELMDNNPMVCADRVSIPDPFGTLALIAIGPLALAGILVEPATLIYNQPPDEMLVERFLGTVGWADGATFHTEERDLGSVLALTSMAAIETPADWSDIDDLYDERFGKSFFVRREEGDTWDPVLVAGLPWAVFRLRFTPGESTSLLTIQVLADKHGKCGEAQLVHAMNVMAGFEESLGIA
jgi:hypothetical protein